MDILVIMLPVKILIQIPIFACTEQVNTLRIFSILWMTEIWNTNLDYDEC